MYSGTSDSKRRSGHVLVDLDQRPIACILLGEQEAPVRHGDRAFGALEQISNELNLGPARHDARDVESRRVRRGLHDRLLARCRRRPQNTAHQQHARRLFHTISNRSSM